MLYPSELAWWQRFEYQSPAYQAEKQKILETTLAQWEPFFPGISAQVEVSDVATPYTMRRYTHNWGAAPGFIMTKALAGEMTFNPQYSLPGLAQFYLAGQWVKGFGVPMAAQSGKEVIQALCKADGVRFSAG